MTAMPVPSVISPAQRGQIVGDLRALVPGEGVVTDPISMKVFESDGLTAYAQMPLVVVLPETVAQVAAVLAYCHLNGGDVKVDFFTARARAATVHLLDAFGSLLVGLFGALIAWRAWEGAMSVKESGETSMILGWPLWLAQALMVPGFVLMALAGFYMMGLHWRARRPQVARELRS